MATPQATIERVPPAPAGPDGERRDIVRAARTVLAREGWRHCTAEATAAEAGVEPEVVGRHFPDHEQLLLSVLLDSSVSVAATLAAVAESYLAEITDLRQDLIALGRAWLAPLEAFREHFAIVRHISAEVTSLPVEAVEKWQATGPRQARRELARRLRQVAARGLLEITDADQAAERFILLVPSSVVQRSFHGALPLVRHEEDALIADGVDDFIRLYGPTTSR
ncbi:TetR/AcrR family transcriptional regulator C-terminal domain-containing protein [Streptomyces sp. NBC_00091]|uniref:TetR/AcrR family transcriptional regulator C-terminal domain-containing protein n=1 Tax=Streptomyces sp. NBC_00091 TaxID=2975648 RepID=UPI00224E8050|nr:TetR/AcrR family transcriptional regulator C-terminal domain-containing protein [Streptomyces sp. NBC_00091]MCX5381217.1 TetR/AcrR family transcriptional regulator C-terminal domain-containing protein [Streptomyces sp. NBC_00091]